MVAREVLRWRVVAAAACLMLLAALLLFVASTGCHNPGACGGTTRNEAVVSAALFFLGAGALVVAVQIDPGRARGRRLGAKDAHPPADVVQFHAEERR